MTIRKTDGMHVIPTGKWFDEFEVGAVYPHPFTRTITEADNVMFSTQTMNPAPLHIDADYASTTAFGKPLVNSLLTLGFVVGISVNDLSHGTTVANLGFDKVIFPAPLFHGDTIHVETEVLDKRLSESNPTRGIVTLDHRAYNQDDVLVCSAIRNAMIHVEK